MASRTHRRILLSSSIDDLVSSDRAGTILGAVFATMYPDKIERMVLDGVADTEEYFRGNVTADLLDTDKAVDVFFDACYEAGPELCAFYDSSPEQISANLDALYDALKVAPVPALISESSFGVVDYGMLKDLIRNVVYSPYQYFPALAQGLALLLSRSLTLLSSRLHALHISAQHRHPDVLLVASRSYSHDTVQAARSTRRAYHIVQSSMAAPTGIKPGLYAPQESHSRRRT